MSRIIEGVLPPGGWHYEDPTGYRIPYKGEAPSKKDLIHAIMEYRLENRIPVGHPEQELEQFLCTKFPRFCHPHDMGPAGTLTAAGGQIMDTIPGPRTVDHIAAWANALYEQAGRLEMATLKEADTRADVCRQCPMQKEWEGECPQCVTAAQRVLMIVRQGKEVTHWRKLKSCGGRFCTRTAVHIAKQHLQQPPSGAPATCWMYHE
jgi:hypothetical protein